MSSLPNLPPAVLPNWVPRKELSRPSAETLNRVTNRKQTLTYAGPNAVIPIVYGEQIVSGPVIAGPVVGTSLYWAVALCYSGSVGVEKIETIQIGETVVVVPDISDPNTPSTGGVGGISFRIYDGRQTVSDSVLNGQIPGFGDAFEGIAYAVLSINVNQSGNFSALPAVTFRIKGRRTRTTGSDLEWSENPVDHMRDFVTNTEFGMGAELVGWEAARDVADSLYSGLPRCQTGMSIQDPMTQEDALALFAECAEVLWSYDGRDVVVIPDYPAAIHDISADVIREGSLQLSTVGLESIPTQVRITFSDRNEPIWSSRPAVVDAPEHTMHGLPTSPSAIPLPEVYQRLEAERRAYQRLARLQTPGRVQWQMFAPGMPYQAGDIVRLPDRRGLSNLTVRLMAQPEMIAPMLYQMAGEIYKASNYPDGAEGVAIPTGAIVILTGTAPVPLGWSLVDTNNRLIREGPVGNQGSLSNLSYTFGTTSAGGHTGGQPAVPWMLPYISEEFPVPPLYAQSIYINNPSGNPALPNHAHSYSVSTPANTSVTKRPFRFIKRTDPPGLLSAGMAYLGAKSLSTAQSVEVISAINGYLNGWDGSYSFPPGEPHKIHSLTHAPHRHNALHGRRRVPLGAPQVTCYVGQEVTQPPHTVSTSVVGRLRSMALAMFESIGDAALPEGAIVGWESGTIPNGWALCDGTNGTIDLSERFIYITRSEEAGVEHESESTYSITSGSISFIAGHTHVITVPGGPAQVDYRTAFAPHHNTNEGEHTHGISPSTPGVSGSLDDIQRYQLRFIQYLG